MTIDRPGAAMRGVLKRKFAEVEEEASYVSSSPSSFSSSSSSSPSFSSGTPWESDGENHSSGLPDLTSPSDPGHPASLPVCSILKKQRRAKGRGHNVSFDTVTVFHFPRCQGFVSVPSHGGASLGMAWNHSTQHRYTLEEHADNRQRRHRERLRERLREERLEEWRHKLVTNGALARSEADRLTVDQLPCVFLEVPPGAHTAPERGVWSLQPYPYRQRQALLRGAGVRRIDREEKRQLHALRLSREECGCDCRGFCEPETCACSLAGIKCQMDRSNFPCSCSQDSCGNSQGRSEFNPGRVKTHYLHTTMRMHLAKRLPVGTADSQEDQRQVPGQCSENDRGDGCAAPDTREAHCALGFSTEEEGGLLFTSMPLTTSTTSTAFGFIPERVEEEHSSNSCDATDSSSSSADSGTPCHQPGDTEETGHLASVLGMLDSQHTDGAVMEGDPASASSTTASPLDGSRAGVDKLQDDANRTLSPSTSSSSSSSSSDYLDDTTDFFAEDSLEVFPHAVLFSANYSVSSSSSFSSSFSSSSSSSNGYVDLSVSSDSDLEFFDSDYLTCGGPLHNSFKGSGHPDGLGHLQILTSCSLPRYPETSVCLLESLIGSSSEPITEDAHMLTYSQLLEVLQ